MNRQQKQNKNGNLRREERRGDKECFTIIDSNNRYIGIYRNRMEIHKKTDKKN